MIMVEPVISFENVGLNLGGTTVFDTLNLSINPGELIVILGPNGA
jgi:2-aminoethylphosphonate transport system ATP-binding protein